MRSVHFTRKDCACSNKYLITITFGPRHVTGSRYASAHERTVMYKVKSFYSLCARLELSEYSFCIQMRAFS